MGSPMDYEDMGLSTKQKDILKKFRSNLQDILTPDHTDPELLKWLRGSNYHFKKAEREFRMVDSCRKIYRFNTIMETYTCPEAFGKYSRTAFLGFAKDGSAMRYYSTHADLLGLALSHSMYDVDLFFVYNVECDLKRVREQNRKTGQKHTKITFIIDFDEFCYSDMLHNSVINGGLEIFSKYQQFYPETWSKFLLVNAPYIMDKILMIFKPAFRNNFMDAFHTATKSSTSTLLKKYIDEDSLPVFLGGSKVDSNGDPNFRAHISPYRQIPKEYHLKNAMHFINEEDPGVKVETIRPWGVFNVPVIVKDAGSKIRVETRTEDGMIYFTVLYASFPLDMDFEVPESNEKLNFDDTNSNLRTVAPRLKAHTDTSPFDFNIHAEWPGAYIFYFENGSNWFTSIKLFYRMTVLPTNS